jgi:hypothetical protein
MALVAATSTAWAQDSVRSWGEACGLGMVPNETRTTFATSSEQAFRDSYCGEWYTSHKQDIEGSAGVKIAVIKVSADGSSITEDVTHEQFCGNPNYRSASMTKWEIWSRTVSDDTRREFFRCVEHAAFQSGPASPVVIGATEETAQSILATVRWDLSAAHNRSLTV